MEQSDLVGLVVEYRGSSWCVVGSSFGTVLAEFATEAEADQYIRTAELRAARVCAGSNQWSK